MISLSPQLTMWYHLINDIIIFTAGDCRLHLCSWLFRLYKKLVLSKKIVKFGCILAEILLDIHNPRFWRDCPDTAFPQGSHAERSFSAKSSPFQLSLDFLNREWYRLQHVEKWQEIMELLVGIQTFTSRTRVSAATLDLSLPVCIHSTTVKIG